MPDERQILPKIATLVKHCCHEILFSKGLEALESLAACLMEFVVGEDGLMTERSIQELASWYSDGGPDQESFEAHLLLLRAYNMLVTSAQRGRRATLTRERFSLLRLLYRHPSRRMLMGELSRALEVSPASITKLAHGLTRLNLVQRLPDAQDKRRTWIELTPEGSRLAEESLPGARQLTRARWQGLTREEKRMLSHLLSKLIFSLQSSAADERMRALREEAASQMGVAPRK